VEDQGVKSPENVQPVGYHQPAFGQYEYEYKHVGAEQQLFGYGLQFLD
jgi:hypothetical protein